MNLTRVAIATVSDKGLKDQVSTVFARTETFTIIEIENSKVKNVKVVKNPALSLERGRDPVVVQTLKKHDVNVAIASEFGPGVSATLEKHRIQKITVKPRTPVIDVVREFAFSILKLHID